MSVSPEPAHMHRAEQTPLAGIEQQMDMCVESTGGCGCQVLYSGESTLIDHFRRLSLLWR